MIPGAFAVSQYAVSEFPGDSTPYLPIYGFCLNASMRIGFDMQATLRIGFDMNASLRLGFDMQATIRECC